MTASLINYTRATKEHVYHYLFFDPFIFKPSLFMESYYNLQVLVYTT